DERRALRRPVCELARRIAEVEALDLHAEPLARERSLPFSRRERARILDLARAEDLLVAARERLADRRCGPEDVDDDADRSGDLFGGREGDVDAHAARLAAAWPPATGTRTGRPACRAPS